MFESAEIGAKLSKAEYAELVPQLRVDLLNAQFDLREANFALAVLLEGDDRVACRRTLAGMHEWMDGRYVRAQVFGPPTEEEREHPLLWRYWRRLPRHGLTAAMYDAWAVDAVRARTLGEIDDVGFAGRVQHLRRFEEQLVDNGTQLVKLWFHISRAELAKRVKKARKNPKQAWRLGRGIDDLYERYDEAMAYAETLITGTSTGAAPWTIIESVDKRHANVTAARTVLASLQRRLESESAAGVAGASGAELDTGAASIGVVSAHAATPSPGEGGASSTTESAASILDTIDLSATVDDGVYEPQLEALQDDLAQLTREAYRRGVASVLAFEGWDAAGKGGSIRRLIAAVDPRVVRAIPVSAPTPEEAAHHYLWRFWQHVPRAGRLTVFDRSWYGRVLVERVEGYASEVEWRRAYAEIRDFEDQLVESGIVLCKFWLHVSEAEQLSRFDARKATAYKKYKLTDEDKRNRAQRPAYTAAVDEMIARTSTSSAPWTLLSAEDKRHARVRVLETYRDALKARLATS